MAGFNFSLDGVQRTMLQQYANQTDIPEALREHYSKREDGQWHADIPDTHLAVKHNAKLLSEKSTAEGKVTQLTSELESARAGNLGRGQVAVAKSEAALLDEYKPLGTPAELKVKVDEHGKLTEKIALHDRDKSLRQVAKDLSYNEEAFVLLSDLPEFISKPGKDGKAEWFAQVKDDKGVITEKPAKEFVESSPRITPFLPSLKAAQTKQVEVPGGQMTTTPSDGDPFAWAREFGKNWNESRPATDVKAAFGLSNAAS
jgi:hypothetical protein